MENKNLFLSAVLILGFLLFWNKFVINKYAPPKIAPQVQANSAPATSQDAGVSRPLISANAISNFQKTKNNELGIEEFVVIEDGNTKVTFGTMGGRVASWQLKEGDHWIELVTNPLIAGNGKIINPGQDKKWQEALHKSHPLETDANLNFNIVSHSNRSLVLEADHPNGFRITKNIELNLKPYLHNLQISYTNLQNGKYPIQSEFGWSNGLNKTLVNAEAEEKASIPSPEARAVAWAEKIMQWKKGMIFGRTVDKIVSHEFEWIGVDNSYFIAAFMPSTQPLTEVRVVANKELEPTVLIPVQFTLEPGETRSVEANLFVAPKILEDLKFVGHNLDHSIDFGFFGIIAKGIYKIINALEGITGNYGWAIVILTIIYQILVFPLTKKSLAHSIKMKEVQPQIKKLQEQFKGDPKRLQVETLNLYKKHGMKFMGMEGCIPMVVQIPFFFAIYSTLQVAYEFRGAPWIFWIHDLAAPDPLYILPVIMGLATFLQQKVTSVSLDPAQAKMMLFMPVFLVFIFLKMPSGLVLYWCTQSVVTIIIQKFLQMSHPSDSPPALA